MNEKYIYIYLFILLFQRVSPDEGANGQEGAAFKRPVCQDFVTDIVVSLITPQYIEGCLRALELSYFLSIEFIDDNFK